MEKTGEEFVRRSGHRFNLIIKSLPSAESLAISIEELLERLRKIGYRESPDQLRIDISALIKRKEVAESSLKGKSYYWSLPRGQNELRKRILLIKLHNMELTEEDIAALEKIAKKSK
ncbi:MAG: hypothetical protein ABSF36_06995 [Candidatus Methanomethylicaceae archaeon]|jgi:hypothetical protein